MSTDLRSALTEHLDHADPPAADLTAVVRAGTRRRHARRAAVGIATAAVVAAAVGMGLQLGGGDPRSSTVKDYPAVGQLDFDGGLRAYADPGVEIHLGGRTFDASDLKYLDTDAVATPYGVVFYDAGRPMLLEESGKVRALVEGALGASGGFHPTAKADSVLPLIAYATVRDGVATIAVRDMERGVDVGTLDVECGSCEDLVIDGIDGGIVFLRDGDGTRLWDTRTDADPVPFAGPDTRVADVRSGVVLYSGPAPAEPIAREWLLVAGQVDSQLTFDGRHVLAWSSILEPTTPEDEPVVLEQGPRNGGLGFWNLDTDGSVLVAALTGDYPEYTVFDCEVPSGDCVEVGPLTPTGGDPQFIGNDM